MKLLINHRLFFFFLVLFFVVAGVDLLNLDRFLYKQLCSAVLPWTAVPCADFYDIPIWNVYLLLAVLTALYNVHAEIRTTNKHLASHKK
ncbi:MAG: hypothetical protein A3C27_01505 [Candidatus Levybacteria bacterium RIFCSPHIGHO2_02_FULL_39_36]|nr:MAG: hypothetical protein A3C27_01505 [Candidatus Levybacteria bacterium RIFCSPHIGHO2_02_FULL_39_36]OGH47198.1 MAG: hypothetical protein A3G66_00705 [Candidatus Levybacteria bacterium RIFCSPLOWO2_12_FULL_39_17]